MVMDDQNARVGEYNTGRERAMNTQGFTKPPGGLQMVTLSVRIIM